MGAITNKFNNVLNKVSDNFNDCLFLLVYLNGLDAAFTLTLLSTGRVREANPLMDYLITNHGANVFIFVKMLFIMISCGLFLYVDKKYPDRRRSLSIILLGSISLYTAICGMHIIYGLIIMFNMG